MTETPADVSSSHLSQADRSAARWLFVFLFCIYALSAGGHTYSTDEEAMYAATEALAKTGQPFVRIDASNDGHVGPAATVGREGRHAVFASWGQSIAGLPLYAIGSAFAIPMEGKNAELVRRTFTGWTGSVATAAGVALFFLISRLLGASRRGALILGLAYGLGTFAWPHSKTFFSEPMTTTLLLGSWYFALKDDGDRRNQFLSGLLAGASLIWRTTSAVMIPPIAIWLLVRALRRSRTRGTARVTALVPPIWFGVGSLIPLAFIGLSNWWRFGSATDFGYPTPQFALEGLPTGLRGLFLSPGKSLFLFAPIVIAGVISLIRIRHSRSELWLMFSSAMTSALLFAAYVDWHGDHTWGPRYLVMSLPFMILGLAQFMDVALWRRVVLGLGVLGICISSLAVVINFNAYFQRASAQLPTGFQNGTDDLLYWQYTHFDPYWSQVSGHVRLLPFTLKSTALHFIEPRPRMDPFPSSIDEMYDWYLAAPLEADSWVIWLRQARGPIALGLLAPLFALGAVFGFRRTWQTVNASASEKPTIKGSAAND